MIKVTLQPEKPLTDKEIKKLAKEHNLKVKSEIKKGKQYIYLYVEESVTGEKMTKPKMAFKGYKFRKHENT